MELSERARLALDTMRLEPRNEIPAWQIHPMEWRMIDRLAGLPEGSYRRDPVLTYVRMLENSGVCLLDQWLADNPLTMGDHGVESGERGATTGAEEIILDGMRVDSPEAVIEHMERFAFPRLRAAIADFDEEARLRAILQHEAEIRSLLGSEILKSGHGFIAFPTFEYGAYGYAGYFMACSLYPEIIERLFSLQADLAVLNNRAAARACREGNLPPLHRLDHDMADSKGTLASPRWLDRHWLPHFERSLRPLRGTGVKPIWHCDGNLMEMVPRLLEAGIEGFQGFQTECGMDYPSICRRKTRDGDGLVILAGVSVTRTLPFGTPDDVRGELRWLVENGPERGLFLGGSSSITPGVPWENLRALVEGLNHYRTRGRRSG